MAHSARIRFLIAALVVFVPAFCAAQQPASFAAPEDDAAAMAKKLANPISDLVSLPFQLNWEQGVGPNDQTRLILNVQPVMPFSVNQNWNLIARVIMPFISQPPLSAGGTPAFGVGDILASAFLSPKNGPFVWGVGPAVSLPSTTQPTLGTEKWSAGPTIVVLKQSGPVTYGALWNQIWSFAGNSGRDDVNQMYVQPFLAYNTRSLMTLTLSSESSANWKAADHKWTVPIIASVAQLASFGTFPASYQIGVGVFAAGPDGAPSWKLRAAMTLIIPKKK